MRASEASGHSRRRVTLLAAVVFLGLLVAALYVAWALWTSVDVAAISTHGFVALALGAVFSLAVGGGLMALVFFSSRRGMTST